MKLLLTSAAVVAFLFTACQSSEPPIVGGDRDSHGCIGSAGYSWSPLRKKCIRVFEDGVRLEARAQGLDATLSAFAVFLSATDRSAAELHLPGQTEPIALTQSPNKPASEWLGKGYTLALNNGTLTLSDKQGQPLYQGLLTTEAKPRD